MQTKTFLCVLLLFNSVNLFSQREWTNIRDWKPSDTTSYFGTFSILPSEYFSQESDQITLSFENGIYKVNYLNADLIQEISGQNLIIIGNQFSFDISIDNVLRHYKGKFVLFDMVVTMEVNYGKQEQYSYHNMKGIFVDGIYYQKSQKLTVISSSVLIEKNKDATYYGVQNLTDCDYNTAWVEGVAGNGIGESVQFNFEIAWLPTEISIFNGFAKNNSLYLKNSRPKELKLTFSDSTVQIITLKDIMTLQTFNLNTKQKISWIKIEIVDVYKGTLYEDNCISEIQFN